jgi:hypothetical protein
MGAGGCGVGCFGSGRRGRRAPMIAGDRVVWGAVPDAPVRLPSRAFGSFYRTSLGVLLIRTGRGCGDAGGWIFFLA